jgi:hypothetical protein
LRLIFSRKGFDSTYGGGVSPILPDGTLVSIPIPESGSGIRYANLRSPRGTLLELLLELGVNRYKENKTWRVLDKRSEAHLDPDLYPDVAERHPSWRPVFGQCDTAQGVLRNRNVSKGDLFIFYGSYRHAEEAHGRLIYRGKAFHAIFGYMSVGEIIAVNSSTTIPWCAKHPHLVNRNRRENTLYIAADSLSLNGLSLPGSGTLPFAQSRVLSRSPERLSLWQLPRFFHPKVSGNSMSNHLPKDWTLTDEAAYLQTKSPGQEYVVIATEPMLEWITDILPQ